MTADRPPRRRCAVYTRKSSEEGLEQAFNSLDAQREACEAYIKSQIGEGWQLVRNRYDDGGLSGGTLERPALQQLLADIKARKVETVVVYKVDRLTRSLADFAKIVEVFDTHGVSFVSVTQQFNTTTSMGRLTLNMLLSFAQFEREVTGERIRDKIAASKRKGLWMGGYVPLGYEAKERTLAIKEAEAETVRTVFRLYLEHGTVRRVKEETDQLGLTTKVRPTTDGRMRGGRLLSRGYIYKLLSNPLYAGRIAHKGAIHEGQHDAIIDPTIWEAVHAKLAGNAHARRSGSWAAEPSLLAGLLYDERGNRLTPSHAVKKGIRYRYYLSQPTPQHRQGNADTIIRIPAPEIEDLVSKAITSFFKSSGRLIGEISGTATPRDQQQLLAEAKKQDARWPQLSASGRRTFLLHIVTKVVVRAGEIRIVLKRNAVRRTLLGNRAPTSTASNNQHDRRRRNAAGDSEFTIRVPVRLKQGSGQLRLVVPPEYGREVQPHPNAPLITALVKAHQWTNALFSGEMSSITTIAKKEGVTDRYVVRMLRLGFLAPDIVEAILIGTQPAHLDLERLRQGLPLFWTDQRHLLGFKGNRFV